MPTAKKKQAKVSLTAYLAKMGACDEALKWARGKTLAQAWRTCPRGDWMVWLIYRTAPMMFYKLPVIVRLTFWAEAREIRKDIPKADWPAVKNIR